MKSSKDVWVSDCCGKTINDLGECSKCRSDCNSIRQSVRDRVRRQALDEILSELGTYKGRTELPVKTFEHIVSRVRREVEGK